MAKRRTRRERMGTVSHVQGTGIDPLGALLALRLRPVLPPLSLIEDRRTWHPEGRDRPVASTSIQSSARRVAKSSAATRLRNDISARIGFAVPTKVVTCIRRKQRKEVMHAYKLVGKGAGSSRRRRDWRSDIDCT